MKAVYAVLSVRVKSRRNTNVTIEGVFETDKDAESYRVELLKVKPGITAVVVNTFYHAKTK